MIISSEHSWTVKRIMNGRWYGFSREETESSILHTRVKWANTRGRWYHLLSLSWRHRYRKIYLKNTNVEVAESRAASCYSDNPVIANLVATADIQVSQGATSTNSNEGLISHPTISKRKLEDRTPIDTQQLQYFITDKIRSKRKEGGKPCQNSYLSQNRRLRSVRDLQYSPTATIAASPIYSIARNIILPPA